MVKRILITGGDGQVGREFAELPAADKIDLIRVNRAQLDVTDAASIKRIIELYQPHALINSAAYTAVDRAETETEQAYAINCEAARLLAIACREHKVKLLHISTDYVFDGTKPLEQTWLETDTCNPQSVYGASKLAGEQAILAELPDAFILRTSWVFGRFGNNFVKTMLRLGAERDSLNVVNDQFGGPTHALDIAATLVKAAGYLIDDKIAGGIYHYGGSPHCSWQQFAEAIMQAGVAHAMLERAPTVNGIPSSDYPTPAKRPANSQMNGNKLASALGIAPSNWQHGLDTCLSYWKTSA